MTLSDLQPRRSSNKAMRCALLLLSILFALTGCNTPEHIEITNHTDQSLYVQLALPYPAYSMFGNHHRYNARLAPGMTWATQRASANERRDLELLKPNDLALLRLFRYGHTDWSAYVLKPAAELFEVDPVSIDVRLTGEDDFVLSARDEQGRPVELEPIDNAEWFAQP